MSKDGNQKNENILNLTLEIIRLLTGEGYTIMRKPSKPVTDSSSSPSVSEGSIESQSPITTSPPKSVIHERSKDKKILERTDKIIQILSAEVPVRSEDVTVYLSMDEWKYLEGHKNLYKDMMMENHQPLRFQDGSKGRAVHEGIRERVTEPLCLQANSEDTDSTQRTDQLVTITSGLPKNRIEGVSKVREESAMVGDGEFTGANVLTLETTQRDCAPDRVKEKSPPCKEGYGKRTDRPSDQVEGEMASSRGIHHTDVHAFKEQPQSEKMLDDMEESASCDEGNLTDGDAPTDDEEIEYTTTQIKEESSSCEEDMFPDIYTSSSMNQEPAFSVHGYPAASSILPQEEDSDTEYTVELDERNVGNGTVSVSEDSECAKTADNLTTADDPRNPDDLARTYNCSMCHKCFANPSDFVKHLNGHRVKQLPCSYCNKTFTCNSNLARHMMVHTGEKPFACAECGKCFTQKACLVRHQLTHTEYVQAKPFSCPKCGKSFAQRSHLAEHHRTHTGEKPFSCSECGKCFTSRSTLFTHRRVHTGEKPFTCPVCGKRFSRTSSLIEHQRIHTGVKPYSCTDCGKSFSHKQDLLVHSSCHTGEKPYSCSECGKTFDTRTYFATHQRIHTGEKPYCCSECGKCFTAKSTLAMHRRVHTGEKPYSCTECGKRFSYRSHLKTHQSSHAKS